VRIPLDYYRILGVPIQATDGQLSQAYHDRALQLPRREYSNVAITARKRLLDQAYQVLSNEKERNAYDEDFLAKSYDKNVKPKVDLPLQQGGTSGELNLDGNTPWIEIEPEQFVGALLILQELGEYELVIKLAQPYLDNRSIINVDKGRFGEPQMVRADIVLTIALSYLELGREQWQQGQYEVAATSGQKGKELLLKEGLFPSVGGELQTDLYKLRPYRILELLSLSENQISERQKGMQLLKEMLQERNGIDGTGDDHSGLSIDDFLRFIQQLRNYLTSAEQQELFEAEARRPSAVATYLAVYALLAGGFAKKQPALISRAKNLLKRLVQRQDVYLEQAVCCLLLGQTEEASKALELSQEKETLDFIYEHSQDSPDLLPGLCLYGERWLQTEVFSHFRDLASVELSLTAYFADEQVQKYLEKIASEPQSENEWAVMGDPVDPQFNLTSQSQKMINEQREKRREKTLREMGTKTDSSTTSLNTSPKSSTLQPPPSSITAIRQSSTVATGALNPVDVPAQKRNLPPAQSPNVNQPRSSQKEEGETRRRPYGQNKTLKSSKSKGQGTNALKLGGMVLFGFIVLGLIYKVVTSIAFPAYQKEPLIITLNKQVVPIPNSESALLETDSGVFDNAKAQTIIQQWLDAKKTAFGKDYQIDSLATILVEPLLSTQRNRVASLKRSNGYYQYEHQIEVTSFKEDENDPLKVNVVANIQEIAQYYEGTTNIKSRSYTDNLVVQYDLIRMEDQWFIQDINVK
jgi:curved DNA-binding protein CbpA